MIIDDQDIVWIWTVCFAWATCNICYYALQWVKRDKQAISTPMPPQMTRVLEAYIQANYARIRDVPEQNFTITIEPINEDAIASFYLSIEDEPECLHVNWQKEGF